MLKYWLLLSFLALAGCSSSVSHWVTDEANILDAETEQTLSARLAKAQEIYGPQIVVVTTNTLNGENIADYSEKLGNASGIGDKARNDGLLLVVAPVERQTRIEVGRGLRATITNADAQSVINQTMVPSFKQGRFQEGIAAGVDRLIDKIRLAPTKPVNDNTKSAASKDAA
jgi:uncharacterized protein